MKKRDFDIEVRRSARKTIALEIRPDGSLLMRVPRQMTAREIDRFLDEQDGWIRKHLAQVRTRQAELPQTEPLTAEQIRALADQALQVIPERVRYYAPLVGVTYGRITIRNQRTRWGSCSAKGNLNFNCLLMLMPPEILDYVVVHELAHRREMNHSPAFWAIVESVLPDYRARRQWLKEHGGAYMQLQEPTA